MQAARTIDLRREFATAIAVLAMLLQVVFAPVLAEHHAYSLETDYGLEILCGSPLDHADAADGTPSAPAPDHQSHDCPCCLGMAGHAVLPEAAVASVRPSTVLPVDDLGWIKPQVVKVATISLAQMPRAPPRIG